MVSINLQDSVAAALTAQAQAKGLTLDAFLIQMAGVQSASRQPPLTVEEFDRLLDEVSVDGPAPDCTYTRAEIYLDHD